MMMPTRQHANTTGVSDTAAVLFLGAWLLAQSLCFAQTTIDLNAKVDLQFDGKTELDLSLSAELIDGFTYKIPVELRVADDVSLNDLNGQTICQCASLQFDKKSIAGSKDLVTGNILLRPKSSEMAQILDANGTRPGDLESVVIGRVKVKCKIYAPLSLVPSAIEITDGHVPISKIEVQVSEEVEILEATMSDSNSVMVATFDPKDRLFRIVPMSSGLSLKDSEGELSAAFVISYKGKKANYAVRIPYAPKPAARVIPSTVAFKVHEERLSRKAGCARFRSFRQRCPSIIAREKVE